MSFAIIEPDDGLAVAIVQPGQTLEEAAVGEHGTFVDPGPYATYEDAYDARCKLNREERRE